MPKLILIYSDGTGQRGGLRPDQRLSNIYKLYRATRPGPDSPIDPSEQVAFYDAGLGRGEVGGLTFRRVRQALEAMIGTGIDTNIVDCYSAIIANYEEGDKVLLFGFSRGAYTVRALSSLMNLCGVPVEMPDGSPVPKHGKALRKIAEEAVFKVYNHGAGKPRPQSPFFRQREELGRRFRVKYKSYQNGDESAPRGNVEPHFIGVFDTVAALGNNRLKTLYLAISTVLLAPFWLEFFMNVWWPFKAAAVLAIAFFIYWPLRTLLRAWKTFLPSSDTAPTHPDLSKRRSHLAFWRSKNYDRFLSGEVGFARHALAIDEERANFRQVGWASSKTVARKQTQTPAWLKQVWFAGCHSDIGGSYPESESRLSDIALSWMVDELTECVPDVQIREDMLNTFGDPSGLQHRQIYMLDKLGLMKWKLNPRYVSGEGELHPSVIERFESGPVPVLEAVEPYRPEQLRNHPEVKDYYE